MTIFNKVRDYFTEIVNCMTKYHDRYMYLFKNTDVYKYKQTAEAKHRNNIAEICSKN